MNSVSKRQLPIMIRSGLNGMARAHGIVPRGTAKEVCTYLKLVEIEMIREGKLNA
jgi:hypothetical protein